MLEDLSVLVVEANQGMRAQLRSMLEGFQLTRVQFAPSAGAALRKLRDQRFDLILCEYNLGDGQDGQHLLEDLRNQQIIPLDTLFVMISSERSYERIVGAAELAPNDYILKPLTASALLVRLQRAVAKRDAFLPIHRAIAGGDPQEAIELCVQAEQAHPAYRTDFMRLRAELHGGLGQARQAEAVYRDILATRPIPWAQLGLARTLFASGRLDDAETILEALVAESTYYLDAYDWLARVREALGFPRQACEVLASAVELSPHRVGRLRRFGELAVSAGDYEAAERALEEVVRKGKHSDFRDPEDHLRLVRSQLLQQRFAEAEATIRDLDRTMGGTRGAAACSALSKALLHQGRGEHAAAREAMRLAVAASRDEAELSTTLKCELVRGCLDHQLEAEGSEVVADILRNAGDEQTIEMTRAVLRERGREDLSERIEERLHAEVRQYIAAGARKAQGGDYDGAVSEMMSAVRRMPGNPHVLFNAALALLRHIEHNGWNDRFAAQARTLIQRTRRLDPANPRLEAIGDFLRGLVRKHGIRPATATAPRGGSRADPDHG
ncbi:MAG TPA: response regulator [Rhodocyclaceae bacterium]|nr:response regulator [Rhodocyclaceae bacterium]